MHGQQNIKKLQIVVCLLGKYITMLYHIKTLIKVECDEGVGVKEDKDFNRTPSKYDNLLTGCSVFVI